MPQFDFYSFQYAGCLLILYYYFFYFFTLYVAVGVKRVLKARKKLEALKVEEEQKKFTKRKPLVSYFFRFKSDD